MKRAAVIAATGFEEGETLTIIDIMRRAGLGCDAVGLEEQLVSGAHGITLACDRVLSMDVCEYDMIVLPGGIPGALNLRKSDLLMAVLAKMNEEKKYVCAMCAAPIALERAGVLDGKNYTAYVGYDEKISTGIYQTDEVVIDGHVVTSRGPATAYAFAYKLAELMGGDADAVKKRMLYDHAFAESGQGAAGQTKAEDHASRKESCESVRAAVLMAEGYEEGETLTIVDILRRAGIESHTFSFGEKFVRGMHGMMIRADKTFSEAVKEYDMLVLPGGRPGGANLRENPEVIRMVRYFAEQGRYVAAMCSGTQVLSEAKVIEGKHVTGYTGYGEKLTGAIFEEDVVVTDGFLVTSQGPATVYPFAYRLAEVLGKDVSVLKERMLYNFAGGR